MKKKLITEALKVSKAKDLKGQPIAFIDPNLPENKDSYSVKDILSDNGANWSRNPRFKNNFPPHSQGFWFWFIGATPDKWRNMYSWRIEPAIEQANKVLGASPEESKESLIFALDVLIDKIKTESPSYETDVILSPEEKNKIVRKLDEFKFTLTQIGSDEEFKAVMKQILALKSAQGHQFSLGNTLLIMIQRPSATIVKSKTNWFNYNRTINQGAKPIFLWRTSPNSYTPYSKEEKAAIIAKFVKDAGKNSAAELTPQEKERLSIKTSGKPTGHVSFVLYDAYDVADTTLMEGKEDLIAPSLEKSKKDIQWHVEDERSEDVRPVYEALMDYAEKNGIKVELAGEETLGGARGMSSSGKITLLHNEGDDVGLTKTLAHEIAHELLHQTYLKGKNAELNQYFLGTSGGRGLIEQQAELTAWMVLAAFGFDLKTTSLNYVAIWGGRPETMIDVFDNVSKVANHLIGEILKRSSSAVGIKEEEIDIPTGIKHYTPEDVASMLGVENEYQKLLRTTQHKEQMVETFFRLVNKHEKKKLNG